MMVVTALGTDAPDAAPDLRLTLELSDGSRIIGTPAIDRLKLTTSYAKLEIPLSQLRAIEFNGGPDRIAQVGLQNGDLLRGELGVAEITINTIFGQVVIPVAKVDKIRVHVAGKGKALPDGLVLHYTFDADEGDRVTDSSGSGNDGKVNGATYVKEGKVGGAMSFNGQSQAVIVGNPAGLQIQDFTIMAWVKRGSKENVSNNGEDGVIFAYGQAGYGMGILHENNRLFLCKVGFNCVSSQFQIDDDVFHHVAVTRKGSKVVCYLDGIAYPASDYGANFKFNTDAAVGARGDTMGGSFLGLIDEVAVFNRPLSDDEVKDIYESQK